MDIRPPRRQVTVPPRQSPLPPPVLPSLVRQQQPTAAPQPAGPAPISAPPAPLSLPPVVDVPSASASHMPRPRKKWLWWLIGGIIGLIILGGIGLFGWYQLSLRPVSSSASRSRVTIESGSTPAQIATTLKNKQLIRSATAFDIYTRLSHTRDKLQAGTFSLAPSESTQTIVDHLVSGKVDQFKVTFYPGATLTAAPDTPESKKTDVETMLQRAGFSQTEIDAAFARAYDSPLFADKPTGASLEGYVYGDTYMIDSSTTATQLLQTAFNEYWQAITDNNLVAGFKAQGLTLYQGITLASIIQSEMGANRDDMKQVAQIFLTRYRNGVPLGSDVTAYYGADKAGLPRAVSSDTPYNTRLYTGLPPGPISTPGLSALQAVAQPAAGDYMYFLTGDDGKTYFAHTDAEHEANIANHCKIGCAVH